MHTVTSMATLSGPAIWRKSAMVVTTSLPFQIVPHHSAIA